MNKDGKALNALANDDIADAGYYILYGKTLRTTVQLCGDT